MGQVDDLFAKTSDYKPAEVPTPAYVAAQDSTKVAGGWADPEDWRHVDFSLRTTHENGGQIAFGADGRPLNPAGPTGFVGRRLGKWGPNQAVDPVVLLRDAAGLSVLLIERSDTGALAFPGGMLDAEESVPAALSRELLEETGLSLSFAPDCVVHRGIVARDPRNTDNAWMETSVGATLVSGPAPIVTAGDDAKTAQWMRIDASLQGRLYADHGDFLRIVLEKVSPG